VNGKVELRVYRGDIDNSSEIRIYRPQYLEEAA